MGRWGLQLQKKAFQRGANVTLIHGNCKTSLPYGPENIRINYNHEIKSEIEKRFDDADCLIMAAAPCDFRVEKYSENKIKTKNKLTLSLVENEDILKYFGEKKKEQMIIGFAAETFDLYENAVKKLESKNCDYIIANDVSSSTSGFDVDDNKVSIISREETIDLPLMPKIELADEILNLI